ncbi:MAG: NTP transferase domain-containing protein [Deltaproteobacteria bacterium]|nr:NTP transferase domain-containing protein [Deltaproteobacteria bacterium]
MDIYAVVMAGGSGTRFWPASRRQLPKQLLSLTGERTLLQQTVDRLAPLVPPERVLVVTGQAHAAGAAAQLPQVPPEQILAEPVGRNTAAAAGLGAAWVAARDPQAVCLVLPADHLITDEEAFRQTLAKAARLAAAEEVLVTLGLTPRYPATGFGYIEAGEVEDASPPPVHRVAAFHEKPDLATARDYLAGGRHFWNSGMFVWRAGVLLAEMETHLPDLARDLGALTPRLTGPGAAAALAQVYPGLLSISVDHGVMERSRRIKVLRADFGWSDVGSWDAAGELWAADAEGNAGRHGEILAIEARGNLVSAGERLTALLGVDNLVAVVTDDVLLILPKERCQDVKRIIDELERRGLSHYL